MAYDTSAIEIQPDPSDEEAPLVTYFPPPANVRSDKDLVLVECDSFTVTQRDGRLVLELVGATPTAALPPHRNYLSALQIAKLLDINLRSVRKFMAHPTNPIPYVRIGRSPRFVAEEVDRWLREGATLGARRASAKVPSITNPAQVAFSGLRRRGARLAAAA